MDSIFDLGADIPFSADTYFQRVLIPALQRTLGLRGIVAMRGLQQQLMQAAMSGQNVPPPPPPNGPMGLKPAEIMLMSRRASQMGQPRQVAPPSQPQPNQANQQARRQRTPSPGEQVGPPYSG